MTLDTFWKLHFFMIFEVFDIIFLPVLPIMTSKKCLWGQTKCVGVLNYMWLFLIEFGPKLTDRFLKIRISIFI